MNKNIVLCSDGTGNRGGKAHGTNVWRIYKALDLRTEHSNQIAFYDDGVGTEDFSLLRYIGGAFGYGLSQNIKDLYISLVKHYDVDDRIFLFGFSRGAYTVRSLAGLISVCGIIRRQAYMGNEQVLEKLVDEAYRQYRNSYKDPAYDGTRNFRREFSVHGDKAPPIKFIGVWDTVGAVGLPFDELKTALNEIVPVRFHDQKLGQNIQVARHALAIDDQRRTFHPVLFNESAKGDYQDIKQVWFPGVHSNVGGGYPKDGLALVALNWMMEELESSLPYNERLIFNIDERRKIQEQANARGKIYDSRAGAGVFYRYRPRNIKKLCDENAVEIQVHSSVLERFYKLPAGDFSPEKSYAPANLLEAVGFNDNSMTTLIKRLVLFKEALYLAFLFTILATLLLTNSLTPVTAADCTSENCTLGVLAAPVYWLFPDVLDNQLSTLDAHPTLLYLFASILLILVLTRSWMKVVLKKVSLYCWQQYLETSWEQSDKSPKTPVKQVQQISSGDALMAITVGLATAGLGGYGFGKFIAAEPSRMLVVSALVLLVILVVLAKKAHRKMVLRVASADYVPGSRLATLRGQVFVASFFLLGSCISIQEPGVKKLSWSCTPGSLASESLEVGGSKQFTFDIRNPCFPTSLVVNENEQYRIAVQAIPAESTGNENRHIPAVSEEYPWLDLRVHANAFGVSPENETRLMKLFSFLKRHRNLNYLAPVAAIDPPLGNISTPTEATTIQAGTNNPVTNVQTLEADQNGRIYLYVNDSLCNICTAKGIDYFYRNNSGLAEVTVTRTR